jgi:hypothetical protein
VNSWRFWVKRFGVEGIEAMEDGNGDVGDLRGMIRKQGDGFGEDGG